MVKLFPGVGAKIIICLLIFVFLMLVTGTTIIALFKTAAKPVKKTKESIESAVAYTEEYMERSKAQREERRRAHIDICLLYTSVRRGGRHHRSCAEAPL